VALIFLAALLGGCASLSQRRNMRVEGESVVLAGEQPANLCFDHIVKGTVKLRGDYTEGVDYRIDYGKGTIQRTAAARIPDYRTYPLFGLTNFDHSKFKDFSNQKWFAWIDYQTTHGARWAEPNPQFKELAQSRKKLEAGGAFKIISYGDSITAGGDASKPEFHFPRRFASYLQKKFPRAKIEIQDVSIPGYTSQQGVDWFDKKVGAAGPADLVLVGFGMNDHNKIEVGGNEPAKFQTNLVEIVRRIRASKSADVILFSAFPPNENWKFGSHRMPLYAEATRAAALQSNSAYADVFAIWQHVLGRKDQASLLANNINHPNDFGHWLYEQAFEALRF